MDKGMINKVFEFLHNSSCCESASYTVSIHKTRKGAESAMEFHKEECRKEWLKYFNEMSNEMKKEFGEYPFDWDKYWGVVETELLE